MSGAPYFFTLSLYQPRFNLRNTVSENGGKIYLSPFILFLVILAKKISLFCGSDFFLTVFNMSNASTSPSLYMLMKYTIVSNYDKIHYASSIFVIRTNNCLDVEIELPLLLRGAFKSDFWKNLGFCPNWGGGSANPKFWFNFSKGVFVAIWQGFPSPNQQNHQKSHKKSSVTQKVWLFHEKIICLE